MNYVMDSSAIIALLKREPGGPMVDSFLANADHRCWIHAVNLCEVYYELVRLMDDRKADTTVSWLMRTGLVLRDDLGIRFWQRAGLHKANLRRVSLADCFCLTLADRLDAEIVTADHHEFDAIVERGLCRATFIR